MPNRGVTAERWCDLRLQGGDTLRWRGTAALRNGASATALRACPERSRRGRLYPRLSGWRAWVSPPYMPIPTKNGHTPTRGACPPFLVAAVDTWGVGQRWRQRMGHSGLPLRCSEDRLRAKSKGPGCDLSLNPKVARGRDRAYRSPVAPCRNAATSAADFCCSSMNGLCPLRWSTVSFESGNRRINSWVMGRGVCGSKTSCWTGTICGSGACLLPDHSSSIIWS